MLFSEKGAWQVKMLLARALRCGEEELDTIADCGIDFRQIFQHLEKHKKDLTIENLFKAMVYIAGHCCFESIESVEEAMQAIDVTYQGTASAICLKAGYSIQPYEAEEFKALTGWNIFY